MNILRYPNQFKCAFAGVPVSDLANRLASHDPSYTAYFTAPHHIGKSIKEDPEEYKRRSPAWNAHKLKTPLLIHTNTIDDDVNVLEVEHLIKSLKAEGKKFEYEIYDAVPGGHSFDRMDYRKATEIRFKVYRFLNSYLKPPKAFKSLKQMRKAAYRF